MNHSIELWFLILTLFFPRIGLLIAYFTHNIPLNPVPLVGDVLMAVLLPRFLIAFYIYVNLGVESVWFWVHGALAVIMLFSRMAFNQNKS